MLKLLESTDNITIDLDLLLNDRVLFLSEIPVTDSLGSNVEFHSSLLLEVLEYHLLVLKNINASLVLLH